MEAWDSREFATNKSIPLYLSKLECPFYSRLTEPLSPLGHAIAKVKGPGINGSLGWKSVHALQKPISISLRLTTL